jgi:K+-transporting ATPase ATPase C chain
MSNLRPALTLVILMTFALGIVYPLAITGVSSLVFPGQAAGSLLREGATLMGSKLIGQQFSEPRYFWGRPSATAPQPYNGLASGGSNLGPLNPALLDQVEANLKSLEAAQPAQAAAVQAGTEQAGARQAGAVPVDLVTASASGLDPNLSVAGAQFQAARIADARHMAPAAVQALIERMQSRPLFGIIGESQVNVLELNMALDRLREQDSTPGSR